MDGRHAGEPKSAPVEPADSMCSEVRFIDQRRHTHRYDELRRPSGKQPLGIVRKTAYWIGGVGVGCGHAPIVRITGWLGSDVAVA